MLRAAFYKGTHAGMPGIYNRLVRAWERGPYSHVELVFNGDIAASSSFMDHGVRFKQIDFDTAKWDFIDLPECLADDARAWFTNHLGEPYDIMGNVHLVVGFAPEGRGKSFCSEAVAASLGFPDPWRFGPNALHSALSIFTRPASAGFSFCETD